MAKASNHGKLLLRWSSALTLPLGALLLCLSLAMFFPGAPKTISSTAESSVLRRPAATNLTGAKSRPVKVIGTNNKKLRVRSDAELRQFLASRYQLILQKAKAQRIPLSPKALNNAFKYYYEHIDLCFKDRPSPCKVNKKTAIHNHRFMFIANFGLSSDKQRGVKIDLFSGALTPTTVAVGSGSRRRGDSPKSYNFANHRSGLHTTRAGFLRTGATIGTHTGHYRAGGRRYAYSSPMLNMDGLEARNVRNPSKYTHGAPYCNNKKCGASWGCPAVPMREARALYQDLKGGALWYHYVPQLDRERIVVASSFDPTQAPAETYYAEAPADQGVI